VLAKAGMRFMILFKIKRERKIKIKIKMREKERKGNATILLPHSCFKVAPCSSFRESP
jgi:hypothetical protein